MTHTNYAVAPGEYLQEWLEPLHLSTQETADLLACTPEEALDLLQGRIPITDDIAHHLEHLTAVPATSWLRYETKYQADLNRLQHHYQVRAHRAGRLWELHIQDIGVTQAATPEEIEPMIRDYLMCLGHNHQADITITWDNGPTITYRTQP